MASKIVFAVFISTVLSIASESFAFAWPGIVSKVIDGDSIIVTNRDQIKVHVRLYGIDSPEHNQPFGEEARQHLTRLAQLQSVEVMGTETDKYGRVLAVVALTPGHNLNEEMIKAGYAWVYSKYCVESYCAQWKILEKEAADIKKGLWSDSGAVPPWQWRRHEK